MPAGENPCPTSCAEKCGRQMPKVSKEQMAAFIAMQKKAAETQKAFLKDAKPLKDATVALFKSMKKCKRCKESKYKFVPCEHHLERLKDLSEKMQDLQMNYALKQQFDQLGL